MIQEKLFPVCQLFALEVLTKKHLEKFANAYAISEDDLKHEYLWQRICFGKSRNCPHRSNNFLHL